LPLQQWRVLLALRNNDDDGNNDEDEDNLIWFANNVPLALSCLCRHVGGPTSMAAAVAAANSSS
jgi:hypothetical protein